ncbi:MAG TPA: cyclic nucleotide-binding domain-containing protein [Gaiellaceae bacterium]|nr:cyclic nucleotide-binding domain-containing protein [Gaiellaceae bacterium]
MALGLHTDAKVKMLSRVPLFAGLSKKELAKVASIAYELDFRAGKVLIREGGHGREFFILLEGSAEVTRGGKKLATRTAGEFFGEIALVSHRPRVATVTTLEPCVALVVTERNFRRLVKQSPDIALKVLQAVGERLPADA